MTSPLQRFNDFENTVFADGALPAKTKELIAFAVGHVLQAQLEGHGGRSLRAGATKEELIEAMWVAIAVRAGAGLRGDGCGVRAEAAIAAAAVAQVDAPPKK